MNSIGTNQTNANQSSTTRQAIGYAASMLFLTGATLAVTFGGRTPPAASILPPEDGAPTADEMQTIAETEMHWTMAHHRGKSAALRPLLAPDFLATDAHGRTRTDTGRRGLPKSSVAWQLWHRQCPRKRP